MIYLNINQKNFRNINKINNIDQLHSFFAIWVERKCKTFQTSHNKHINHPSYYIKFELIVQTLRATTSSHKLMPHKSTKSTRQRSFVLEL